MDNIICPHCGKKVQISDAIVHQLQSQVRNEERKKLEAQFEEEKAKESAKREKELRKEFEEENKEKEKELIELEKKMELQEKESAKMEEKIKAQAFEEANKQSRLDKLELEKKLKDTQNALDDAQRKAKQGSQQLQGEVLELDLENKLKATFPQDEFNPIPKGVEGADIWQKVNFQGKNVGSILWETKRTKQWSNLWLNKLKDDAARLSATESVIVSQALPDNAKSFDRKDGVWITTFEFSLDIARYLRFLITSVAKAKSSASQTDEDWSKIRDYMLSDSFKHRMQAHFDAVKTLREVLETEKRTSQLRWIRQQKQIEKLDANTLNFYAELKEIVHNLPSIEEIESPMLSSGDEEDEAQESLI